jgi:hypothetical protein
MAVCANVHANARFTHSTKKEWAKLMKKTHGSDDADDDDEEGPGEESGGADENPMYLSYLLALAREMKEPWGKRLEKIFCADPYNCAVKSAKMAVRGGDRGDRRLLQVCTHNRTSYKHIHEPLLTHKRARVHFVKLVHLPTHPLTHSLTRLLASLHERTQAGRRSRHPKTVCVYFKPFVFQPVLINPGG